MIEVKQCPTLNNFSPLDCLDEESLFATSTINTVTAARETDLHLNLIVSNKRQYHVA